MTKKPNKEAFRIRGFLRIGSAVLALCSALELLGFLLARFLGELLGGVSFSLTKASSIGIIGGADGPTSVLVTASAAPVWQLLAWGMLLVLGIWGFRYFGRSQK